VTPAERRLYQRVQRRAAEVSPTLAQAILRAFQRVREEIPAGRVVDPDRLFELVLTQAVLDVAFQAVRERIRRTIAVAVPVYTKTLPPSIAGEIGVAFDVLSPHVVQAIRALESRVITTLQTELRETVRDAVRVGLETAKSSRVAGKALRDVIGLAPNQMREVENYRVKLERAHERLDALENKLRDKRYDPTIQKARASGTPIPPEKIDRMVAAYRKRRIAQNAAINASTAAKDAQRLANRLAWENAAQQGIVDRQHLWKRRLVVLDGRERPEHHAMSRQEQPFDVPYTNGEMVSGDLSYGCRCTDQYFVRA
jgi:hypothetical protein